MRMRAVDRYKNAFGLGADGRTSPQAPTIDANGVMIINGQIPSWCTPGLRKAVVDGQKAREEAKQKQAGTAQNVAQAGTVLARPQAGGCPAQPAAQAAAQTLTSQQLRAIAGMSGHYYGANSQRGPANPPHVLSSDLYFCADRYYRAGRTAGLSESQAKNAVTSILAGLGPSGPNLFARTFADADPRARAQIQASLVKTMLAERDAAPRPRMRVVMPGSPGSSGSSSPASSSPCPDANISRRAVMLWEKARQTKKA
jgi:hypothetical protein